MKQVFTILVASFIVFSSLIGQITVTSATFPIVGDTLFTKFDNLPSGITITPAGGNQHWDYTSLEAPFTSTTVFESPAEGPSGVFFPSANLYFSSNQAETYIQVTENSFDVLGHFKVLPEFFNLEALIQYNPPYTYKKVPLHYNDINQANSEILLSYPSDVLPTEILDSFPVSNVDSFRIKMTFVRNDTVDAWGVVDIPGGSYNVLREKRVQTRETTIEVKVGAFGWTDVSNFLQNYSGVRIEKEYVFYSDVEKEPIVVVYLNDETDEPKSAEFKSNAVTTALPVFVNGYQDIFVYPNPAINEVRIDFLNLSKGTYYFKIFNILGITVQTLDYEVTNDRETIELDISNLRKGTYLYSLIDSSGRTLKTKRLMVIRP